MKYLFLIAFSFCYLNACAQGNIVNVTSFSGIPETYITRLDEANLTLDTLSFLNIENGGHGNVIDQANEKYIFTYIQNIYTPLIFKIDLNSGNVDTLHLTPGYYNIYNPVYDKIQNRLIYRNVYANTIQTIDLSNGTLDTLPITLPPTANIGGIFNTDVAYDPIHERLLYIRHDDPERYLTYLDLSTNTVLSDVIITTDTVPFLFYDESEDHFVSLGFVPFGTYSVCGIIDPYTANYSATTYIPDIVSNLNSQQFMYDEVNNRLVLPHLNNANENRIAYINVLSGQMYLSDTIPLMLEHNQTLENSVIITDTLASLLQAPVGQSYQWYKNDTLISGATNQNLQVTDYADYYVMITFSNNNTGKSNVIHYYPSSPSSVTTVATSAQINIYPNPFNNAAELTFNYEKDKTYTLSILDQLGRIIRQNNNIISGKVRIEKGDLAPGMYIYRLSDGENIRTGKLQVQ